MLSNWPWVRTTALVSRSDQLIPRICRSEDLSGRAVVTGWSRCSKVAAVKQQAGDVFSLVDRSGQIIMRDRLLPIQYISRSSMLSKERLEANAT